MITAGSAALAAGIAATAGAVGAGMNAYSANMANKWNRREAEKNRKWQEEQWNKQNEYNLPVNQVQRLKDAGLNPNLILGSTGVSNAAGSFGNGAQASQQISPQYGDTLKGIGSAMEMYQNIKMSQSQIDLNEALKNKANKEALKTESETTGIDLDNMLNKDAYQVKLDTYTYNRDLLKWKLDMQPQELENMKALHEQMTQLSNLYKEQQELAKANTDESKARMAKIDVERDQLEKSFNDRLANIQADTRQKMAQAYLSDMLAYCNKMKLPYECKLMAREHANGILQGNILWHEVKLAEWNKAARPDPGWKRESVEWTWQSEAEKGKADYEKNKAMYDFLSTSWGKLIDVTNTYSPINKIFKK